MSVLEVDALFDPVSLELMQNPVILASCGHSFDSVTIDNWFKAVSHLQRIDIR
jgi:hypothetical protein